jgi:uncharacterized protein YdhG (YjbR/CyaY superfamily)
MADTPDAYVASIPEEKQPLVQKLRAVINGAIAPEFQEAISYRALGWVVPHSLFPPGYHCDPKEPVPFIGLSATKSGVSLHMFCLYVNNDLVESFQAEWKAGGRKLDMGKSCVRIKKEADVDFDLIARTVGSITYQDFMDRYVSSIPEAAKKKMGLA